MTASTVDDLPFIAFHHSVTPASQCLDQVPLSVRPSVYYVHRTNYPYPYLLQPKESIEEWEKHRILHIGPHGSWLASISGLRAIDPLHRPSHPTRTSPSQAWQQPWHLCKVPSIPVPFKTFRTRSTGLGSGRVAAERAGVQPDRRKVAHVLGVEESSTLGRDHGGGCPQMVSGHLQHHTPRFRFPDDWHLSFKR